MNAEKTLTAATLRLASDRPYLSAALWAMSLQEAQGLGTLAVDSKGRLYYDPDVVLAWSPGERVGVVYHEVCHLLHDHAERGKHFDDPFAWNLAADAEINDDLVEEGIALPGSPILPATLGRPDGRLAEEYYVGLPTRESSACTIACGRCGSIATGIAEAWEQAGGTEPGLSAGELKLLRRQVAREIREHQRAQGSLPGHWQRWADQHLEPVVNWRQELAAIVRRALSDAMGASDYTYTRPSRRQSAMQGIILPALRQPVPNVAVIADTSGSMTKGMLARTLGEIKGILAAVGQREGVQALSVDSIVQNRQRVTRAEQVHLAGGGGTDMGAGLEALMHSRPRPDVAIVITDGYTPWPEAPPPGIRVVVALTHANGCVPPWAKGILVEPEAERSRR